MWEKCLPPHSTHITLGRDLLVVQGSLELEEIPKGRGAPLTEVPRFTNEETGVWQSWAPSPSVEPLLFHTHHDFVFLFS